jgi:hypothetical protein
VQAHKTQQLSVQLPCATALSTALTALHLKAHQQQHKHDVL